MKKIKLYVDESGNSGPNYLDKDNPYFILAAYLDLEGEVNRLENVEKIKDILNCEEGKNYSIKKKLSDRIFCNLPEEFLFDFAKVYRGNGISLEERIHNMRELTVRISNELERKDAFIAKMIREAINDIENNMRDEEKEESSRLAEQAPNLWLLYNLLLLVENHFNKVCMFYK